MTKTVQRLMFSAAVALICGCTISPVVWTKAGMDQSQTSADIAECRMLARDEAWRMSWEMMWPPPFYDPRFMPPFYRSPRPFWFDFPMSIERERALVDFCMHSKGYRLQAVVY